MLHQRVSKYGKFAAKAEFSDFERFKAQIGQRV
jgi:hypothetical protein